jgi:hypothetical protein
MILRPGGHAEPAEVGVLRQVVSEPSLQYLFSESRIGQKASCDSNSAWNRFEQCHQEGERDQYPIQLWKGK